ncbi:hypothetical protein KAX29_00030, partial [candidate division WOR-3 bacterium]|nr:hypothetical protein [candidate division WOR-3 bacterium]
DNAFEALEKAEEIPPIPEAVKEEAREKLSQVKVASHYRSVTDGKAFNRSIGDVVEIFKETRTDFIVPGWARLSPIPEKCSDLPHGQREKCEMTEYSFEHLRNAVSEIKKEMPNIIFCGALSAEFLNPECWNELTGEKLGKDETWEMALDPSKWGIPMSKEEFQTKVAISHGWTKKGEPYDPKEQMPYYFPDQTNPDYQELFLSWVKKQIDSGVDVIFIDINTKQARVLAGITGDINHIAVEDSFKGASEIADEIHKYGHSKGKNVYVISWATATLLESPYPTPDLDAVMTTLSTEENSKMAIDEAKWETCVKKIKEKIGDIPIFVMFDQGPDYRPLEAFSQGLSKTEQQEMLRRADEFFQRKGLIFIYPIHGGMMGSDERVKVRSYGKFNWYDSLAPEFQTYDTIKELASNKSKE